MMKRNIKICVLILILSIINIKEVKANLLDGLKDFVEPIIDVWFGSSQSPNQGEESSPGNDDKVITPSGTIETNKPESGVGVTGSCYQSSCKINRQFETWGRTDVKLFDMNGKLLGNGVTDKIEPVLAGTYINIYIEENKGYKSWATYTYKAEKKVHTCVPYEWDSCAYKDYGCGGRLGVKGCCGDYVKGTPYTRDCGCYAGDVDMGYEWESYKGDEGACAAKATPYTIDMSSEPSYDITYRDSNDIDTKSPSNSDRYNTMETKIQGQCNNKIDLETKENSMDCNFKYEREKICINVKTGQVAYVDYDEPCLEDEYEIPRETSTSGKTFWKYFIPLNANSSEGFKISLLAKSTYNGGVCKEVIDKYPHYQSLIVDIYGNPLSGNPIKAKLEVEKGCKYQTEITIPVIQKFYNETNEGQNFKGFNFYYKPIDINNPFPNGLTDTSLWYDWNEDRTKGPDISESYDEVTYYASTSGNEESIRKYNNQRTMDDKKKDYPYTSWKGKNNEDINGGMNVNGTSNFIKNQGIVTRNIRTDSFYPLGCGPLNEFQYNEDGSRNYFYQPECDRS